LLESSNVGEVIMEGSTFSSMTADDLANLMSATPQAARRTGKFYLHFSVMMHVRALKDNEGRYIYQEPSATGPATIWGKPVVEVEVFPEMADSAAETSFVLFGDLRRAAWVGVKASGLSMTLSNEATIRNVAGNADLRLFEQDMTALRMVERIGFQEVLPLAVTKLSTGVASS
jgi:HK97 family phage major capsid protein